MYVAKSAGWLQKLLEKGTERAGQRAACVVALASMVYLRVP